MKDIDFDELDRAVSSVLQTNNTSQQDPAVEGQEVSEASSISEEVSPAESAPVAELVTEEAPTSESTSPAVPALKRSGRFMDVMHPSSDMRTATTSASSREGVSVAPADRQPEVIESSAEDTSIVQEASSELADAPDDSISPLQSPFLADAQVEKRPLGGASSAGSLGDLLAQELSSVAVSSDAAPEAQPDVSFDTAIHPQNESVDTTGEVASGQLPPEPEVAVLPAELDSNLVAIESGEVLQPLESPSEPVVSTAPAIDDPALKLHVQMGGGSIPQQYTEQPSTSDQSHTPIYDTEAAVQPLAHPAKKKSGWLTVIWVLVLMILGAGGTLALYFLGYL